jgi:hypothetical protein
LAFVVGGASETFYRIPVGTGALNVPRRSRIFFAPNCTSPSIKLSAVRGRFFNSWLYGIFAYFGSELYIFRVMHDNSLYDPRYRSIIQRLIAARQLAGLNQTELGEKLEIGQPEVSKIEHFVRKIEVLELIDWIKVTGSQELAAVARILDN